MLWNTEEYILVGIFYDVSMIDRSRYKNKSIKFEISLGNIGNHQFHQNQVIQMHDKCSSEGKTMIIILNLNFFLQIKVFLFFIFHKSQLFYIKLNGHF